VALRTEADGTCLEARIALTAVNPAPKRLAAAARLVGQQYSPDLVEEVAREAIRTAKPLKTSASTMEYRRHMIRIFVRRALTELWQNGRSPVSQP
jgi:CO/xanthine dehydrogenase FAD-binding subunit